MSSGNVKSFETAAFKARLAAVAGEKTVDDAVFADLIYTAVSRFGVHEDKFRDTFGISKDTVERWTQRQNLPQALVRGKILAWIAAQLGS